MNPGPNFGHGVSGGGSGGGLVDRYGRPLPSTLPSTEALTAGQIDADEYFERLAKEHGEKPCRMCHKKRRIVRGCCTRCYELLQEQHRIDDARNHFFRDGSGGGDDVDDD